MNSENQMRTSRRIEPVELDAHKKLAVSAAVTKDERDGLDFLAALMQTDRSKIVHEFIKLGLKKSKNTIVDLALPADKRREDLLAAVRDLPSSAFGDPAVLAHARHVGDVNRIEVAWFAVGESCLVMVGSMTVVFDEGEHVAVACARYTFRAKLTKDWELTINLDHRLMDAVSEAQDAGDPALMMASAAVEAPVGGGFD